MFQPAVPEIPGLPDRFQPRKFLSRTSNGDVVEAVDRDRSMMTVALKLLRADGTHAEVARAMFRREVEALKGLRHDGIVQILDWFETREGLLGIELEYIPGGWSLAKLLEEVRIGRLQAPSPLWRLKTIDRLLDAVSEAHRRNVIHRDLKPSNVLWNRDDDTLKLADFGIALVLPLTVRDPAGTTLRAFFTKPYASLEQRAQSAVSFPADVYGFGVLLAAILALREPGEEFEPAALGALLEGAIGELREGGVPAGDTDALSDALSRALLDNPTKRPSLAEIRDVVARLLNTFVPRPEASVGLTANAESRLATAGFITSAKIAEDLNAGLRARLFRDEKGEGIKIFGRTLFAVLRPANGVEGGALELRAVDAGQNPGPTHESQRRNAEPCPVRLNIGPGAGGELLEFARGQDLQATRRATHELVERARLIIEIERERLPYFALDCIVEGGHPIGPTREERIGQASGYEAAQAERVEVNGGFRLRVAGARGVLAPSKRNKAREGLVNEGVAVADPEVFDDAMGDDWYSLFDDSTDIDVLDDHFHLVGKATGYGREGNLVHVRTDRKRRLLRRGTFYVKNHQKERQLRQQEMAIEQLERGETARPDMPHLLAEAAAHRMGEKPWCDLLQKNLTPEARVRDLVNRILASESVFCLQGPPGTGKTTLIAEVVAQVLEMEPRSRILVCSQANDAVANAIERIRDLRDRLRRDWICVRDVRPERAREEGPWAGFDAAYREFCERVRAGALAEADGRPPPVRAAVEDWLKSVEHASRHVERDYRQLVQVWATTTARSTAPLADQPCDLVIIDEAAKATVGEVLVPIVRARRLLLVGDHLQLPPFLEDTTTDALQELGVTKAQAQYSLFEHLFHLVPAEHRDMLDVQFRMHPTIGEVVSRLFYEGRVKNGPGTENRPLPAGDFDRPHRVMWVDVRGRDYKCGKTSRANDEERRTIERLLAKLDADASRAGVVLDVAVIAAYRGQADKLQQELRSAETRWKSLRVKAATVDAFQGREAHVVLYSLVRTGDAERKFLADGRRFNVALSRAKSLLVLVGDKQGARGTERLKQLLELIPAENQVAAETFVPDVSIRIKRR